MDFNITGDLYLMVLQIMVNDAIDGNKIKLIYTFIFKPINTLMKIYRMISLFSKILYTVLLFKVLSYIY